MKESIKKRIDALADIKPIKSYDKPDRLIRTLKKEYAKANKDLFYNYDLATELENFIKSMFLFKENELQLLNFAPRRTNRFEYITDTKKGFYLIVNIISGYADLYSTNTEEYVDNVILKFDTVEEIKKYIDELRIVNYEL